MYAKLNLLKNKNIFSWGVIGMANQQHLDILKQGVASWNKWRKENPNIRPELRGADLAGTNLSGANFAGADLNEADLTAADIHEADLTEAKLFRAIIVSTNLDKARLNLADLTAAELTAAKLVASNLTGAKLVASNLTAANLTTANLTSANLFKAELSKANFTEADLTNANLSSVNLSKAIFHKATLTGANLYMANISGTDLSGAHLEEAKLDNARLIRANLTEANLTSCSIYGISAWNVQLERAVQSGLIITPPNEPIITVDSLEVAQFIYLLLRYEKLRDVINTVVDKSVLILGRFSNGGLKLLQAIAAKLRKMEYLPIIFDFDRPKDRDYIETILTLAGLSRFIIADLSGPSVPDELRAIVPNFRIPCVPILDEKSKPYATFTSLSSGYNSVLPTVKFANEEELIELLPSKVVEPAEEKFKERGALLRQVFNS